MTPEQPILLVVAAENDGIRVDRYIADTIDALSRSHTRKLIDDGHILVNTAPCKASYAIRTGDTITITLPPPQPTEIIPEAIPLDILYEDEHIVIINKPAGMVVHPAPGHTSGTLVHALLSRYPDMHISGDTRPGIVHRLDQDTSGVMVVARNQQAMHMLSDQQKARAMHKAYLLVVEGRFREPSGSIEAPIARHPQDRKRQSVVAHGRYARTHYRVLEELGTYTLVEAVLETGRTHQIRVHFAHIHRPVLADPLYGLRKPRATFGLRRQFLHAHKLGLTLPTDDTWQEYTAPLPTDLTAALDRLYASVRR
jgi:23S rRNA pseudouridine1911/1915/1917 synthase